jgi:dolichol-phosphate mannosyltransferase
LLLASDIASASARPGVTVAPDLTIVVPTFNERANVGILAQRLDSVLSGIKWEVIFVDDNSPDGTSEEARALGQRDGRVRLICRIGRRGLAGAAIEGIMAAQGRYVAVMDGDLQHDERLLPAMLRALQRDEADLAVGSRYAAGGTAAGLSPRRQMASRIAGTLAKRVLRVSIADPMSGFFMMPAAIVLSIAPRLWSGGFKLLMDILATTDGGVRIREFPYVLQDRRHGTSKLDSTVVFDFLVLLMAKATGNVLPPRSLGFVFVGSTGVLVHLAALWMLVRLPLHFSGAQALATVVAMTSNFLLNNALTYRDQRLRGWHALKGLSIFYAVCAIGAVSNIGVASWIYANWPLWWVAGLIGSIIGAVWNYSISSALVWRSSATR